MSQETLIEDTEVEITDPAEIKGLELSGPPCDKWALTTILKPHPRNAEIYEDLNVDDLVASFLEHNLILECIIVLPDFTIISGHRRWRAALKLQIMRLPINIIEVEDPNDVLQMLLEFNRHRKKTVSDVYREIQIQKLIFKRKGIRGRTTDHLAKMVGLGSGRAVERLDFVMQNAPKALIAEMDSEKIGISGAYDQTKAIQSAPEKVRGKIKKKIEQGKTVKQAIVETRQEENAKLVDKQALQGCTGPYGLIVVYANLDYAEMGLTHPGPKLLFGRSSPVLSSEDYADLKINDKHIDELAEDQSMVIFWVPSKLSELVPDILRAWGFDFSGDKMYWMRQNEPDVLVPGIVSDKVMEGYIGTRGSFVRGHIDNWFIGEAPEDCLPEVFYAMVEKIWNPDARIQIGGKNELKGWAQYAATK